LSIQTIAPSQQHRRILLFLALTYALSAPWWALSLVISAPGLPDRLPITDAGAAFMPALSAILLTAREGGRRGVAELVGRLGDWRRLRAAWWLVILGSAPVFFAATYFAMGALGLRLQHAWGSSTSPALAFLIFFLGAIGEELGYTGYALQGLHGRKTAIVVALILGVGWAIWRLPSMIELGQSAQLLVWGLAVTVAFRLIYALIYFSSGHSLFSIVLLHALLNTGRTMFPGGRRGFEMDNAAVGYGIVILTAIFLSTLWTVWRRPDPLPCT